MSGLIIVAVRESKDHIKENLDVETKLADLIESIKSDLSTIYTCALQKLGSDDKLTQDLQEYLRIVIEGKLFANFSELRNLIERQYLPKVDELILRLEKL